MGLINHPACSLTYIIYTEQEQTAMVRLQNKKRKDRNGKKEKKKKKKKLQGGAQLLTHIKNMHC